MRPLRRTYYEPADVGQYIRLAYWGTWDRVIAAAEHRVVVVGLTPINGDWEEGGEDRGKVRWHCTSPEGDIITLSLPAVVEAEVRTHGLGWVLDASPGELVTHFIEQGVGDKVLGELLRNAAS